MSADTHCFRDVGPYEPGKNERVKCKFCGCWAKKDQPCYLCHRDKYGEIHEPKKKRNSVKRESVSQPNADEPEAKEPGLYQGDSEDDSDRENSGVRHSTGGRRKSSSVTGEYKNANNHRFRDVGPYEPGKNERVKCKFCGCWAKKDQPCYLCHRDKYGEIHEPKKKRNSVKRESVSQSNAEEPEAKEPGLYQGDSEDDSDRENSGVRHSTGGRRKSSSVTGEYKNANNHRFRDVGPYEPGKNERVKCKFCGCWAKKDQPCYLCHRDKYGEIHEPKKKRNSVKRESVSQPHESKREEHELTTSARDEEAREVDQDEYMDTDRHNTYLTDQSTCSDI